MIKMTALLIGLATPFASTAEPLPTIPDDLLIYSWSTTFAALLTMDCNEFVPESDLQPALRDYLQDLIDKGIDIESPEATYAPWPDFNGRAVRFLFSISNLRDVTVPDDFDVCDMAWMVYDSDMLTGLMIRPVTDRDPLG